jgi:hypothetical protein
MHRSRVRWDQLLATVACWGTVQLGLGAVFEIFWDARPEPISLSGSVQEHRPGGVSDRDRWFPRRLCGSIPVPVPPRPLVLRPQDVLRARVPFGRSAPSVGGSVLSMNPLSLEGTTMVPKSLSFTRIRMLFRPQKPFASHPGAVPEASLNLPRRIGDRPSAAQLARDHLRHPQGTSRWRCIWTTSITWWWSADGLAPDIPQPDNLPLARNTLLVSSTHGR